MSEPVPRATDPIPSGPLEFERFFEQEYERVLRSVYLMSGDRYESEEVSQEAFVRALAAWDRVKLMENPAGYVYRAAINQLRSVRRRASIARRLHRPGRRGPELIDGAEDRDLLRRALAGLPRGQREALVVTLWLGLTDIEAGKLLRCSPGAIRVRVSRGRATLRSWGIDDA